MADWFLAKMEALPTTFFTQWSYPLLLLFSFAEGIPIAGAFIPGQVVTILAGLLVKLNYLNIWLVLGVAFLGAFLGDVLGYELGRKYGHSFLKHHGKWFFFGEHEYRDLKRLLDDHPAKTLIIGKFHNVTRAFGPFVAGSTELSRSLFLFFNLVASLLWSCCFVFIGYIFGHGFERAAAYVGTFALSALVLVLLILLTYRRFHTFMLRYQHRFLKYPLAIISIASVSIFILGWVTDNVRNGGAITRLDAAIHAAVPALRNGLLTAISLMLNFLFDYIVLTLMTVGLFILFIRLKRKRTAAILAISMSVGFVVDQSIKLIGLHQRPTEGLITVATGSFPSGHTTMATVFCVFLFWAYHTEIVGHIRRWLFETGILLIPVFVGLSRVYLGVHWFSDVLAGWALGLAVFCLVLLGFHVLKQ